MKRRRGRGREPEDPKKELKKLNRRIAKDDVFKQRISTKVMLNRRIKIIERAAAELEKAKEKATGERLKAIESTLKSLRGVQSALQKMLLSK